MMKVAMIIEVEEEIERMRAPKGVGMVEAEDSRMRSTRQGRSGQDQECKNSKNDGVLTGDNDYRNTDKADRRSESDKRNRESDRDHWRTERGVM